MNSYLSRRKLVYNITLIGVLGGLCAFLTLSSFGFISIGPITLTTMHIPVLIAAIVGGPVVGGIVGFIFGISSIVNAIIKPSLFSFAFYNPLISIVPRVLFGVTSGYLYLVLKNKYPRWSVFITAGSSSAIHSGLVLFGLYLFYHTMFNSDNLLAAQALLLIFITNGIPEIIIALILVPPIIRALSLKKKGGN
ncbi:MAG: ECF transporter S component [Culicoidibacterales bacterium]